MARLTLGVIDRFLDDQRGLIEWLGEHRFLDLQRSCPNCGKQLQLQYRARLASDRYVMRCCRCKHYESVRRGSVFEPYRAPLAALARLAVMFDSSVTASKASNLLDLDRHTVTHFYDMVRSSMEVDLDFDPITFTDNVVEIDETLVESLRGGEPGRGRTTGWVFGIVGRESGSVHLEIVPNREGQTLLEVMEAHVPPDTIVCGDTWPAYSSLEDDYTLRTVNKGRGAMSYWDRGLCINVHTGTIEGIWSQLRAELHVSRGFPAHYMPRILAEFMYRKSGRDVYDLLKI